MFRDQVICLWVIVYDQDTDRAYTFTNWSQVLRSIEGSVRTYLDESPEVDCLVEHLVGHLRGWASRPYIPIRINNLIVTVYRWELDPSNPLHRVLARCYDVANDTLKLDIMALFTNPR
jgi:hypothetical protein